jgi:hypothetical protein
MKKIFLLKTYLIMLVLITSTSGCKKYLDEAYLDPNRPVNPNVETLLAPIANNWARGVAFDSRFVGKYIQNFSDASGLANVWDRMGWDLNITNGTAGGEVWRQHYWQVGSTLKYMIEEGKRSEKWDYVGVAYAMFAYSWQTAADMYGDLIVSQAFDNTRLTFDFESQTEAYKLVFQYCDSAIKYLQTPGTKVRATSLLPGDQWMYGGNATRWLRFAYGVKARNFHRFSMKSSGYAVDSVIRYCDSSLRSAADDLTIKFAGGVTDATNFYGQLRANLPGFRQSEFIVNLMNGTSGPFTGVTDPRRGNMLWPSLDSQFRGQPIAANEVTTGVPSNQRIRNPYGLVGTATPTVDTGRYIYRNTAELPVLTYAEIQFLKAEAAFIKGDKAASLTAYRNGINAHFDLLNSRFPGSGTVDANFFRFTTAQRTAYLANTTVVPTDPNLLTLAMIMNQKYIALYFHGFIETWVDLRRYNYGGSAYPSFVAPVSNLFADNSGKLVNRLRPRMQVEFQWNAASLEKIGALQIDYHTKPVWFQIP